MFDDNEQVLDENELKDGFSVTDGEDDDEDDMDDDMDEDEEDEEGFGQEDEEEALSGEY